MRVNELITFLKKTKKGGNRLVYFLNEKGEMKDIEIVITDMYIILKNRNADICL